MSYYYLHRTLITLPLAWLVCHAGAQEMGPTVMTEECVVGNDSMQHYFLIRHRPSGSATPKQFGLLLVLPGGDGGREFLPFCANVITVMGTPADFIVAELIAPVWGKLDESTISWPGHAFPSKDARFTSEEFVDAVIKDVSRQYHIHDGWVFTLGWSSSGHVLYSSSFQNPKIRGSFVAMSRFQPGWFEHTENAKGKRYYFWHSPDDAICPYSEAEFAASFLTRRGALTMMKSYRGGHGWVPFTFYADRIKEAMEWFRAGTGLDGEQRKNNPKMPGANK